MPKVKMTIVGIGPVREGISKQTNQPYCMQDLCVVYNSEYYPLYNGCKAETITIDPHKMDISDVQINTEREAFIHTWKFKTVLDGFI